MRWCVFGLTLNLLLASAANGEEFLFSDRTSVNTYQPRITVPLLTEAFKRAGHSFKSAKSGATSDELRRVYGIHSIPKGTSPNLVRIDSELLRIAMGIFSWDERAVVGDLQQLSGRRVAIRRERQGIISKLAKLPNPARVFWISSDRAAIQMLANGNVEFAIVEFHEGNAVIRSDPKFKNIHSLARLTELRIFAYMHKRHANVAQNVAAILDKMKSQGVFRRIVAKSAKEFAAAIESGPVNTAQ